MSLAIDSTIKLSRGNLPRLGLGVYKARGDECIGACITAIQVGYKHSTDYILVDTAQAYHNEDRVGRALAVSETPRSSIFITTKYMPSHTPRSSEEVYTILRKSLKPLHKSSSSRYSGNNPYVRPGEDGGEDGKEDGKERWIDLLLVHAPFGGDEGRKNIWRAMNRAREEGWARDIGVSNFGIKHLESLPSPLPAVNQIEVHPWCQQREIISYCQSRGIAIQAYCPLVQGDPKRLNDEVVQGICRKTVKEAAQVLIRWSLQKGYATMPKSVNSDRIRSNADVYDFELDQEDMRALDGLDQGKKGACTWNPVDSD